jgi:hypothetical protein
MKKLTLLAVLICLVIMLFPAPKAKAMDPVTIALLAPIALKVAEKARPYVVKGLTNGLKQMLVIGKDMIDFMRLPLGMLQSSFGAPFGLFGSGVKNMVVGGIAPFKMCFHTLMLPVALAGFTLN